MNQDNYFKGTLDTLNHHLHLSFLFVDEERTELERRRREPDQGYKRHNLNKILPERVEE